MSELTVFVNEFEKIIWDLGFRSLSNRNEFLVVSDIEIVIVVSDIMKRILYVFLIRKEKHSIKLYLMLQTSFLILLWRVLCRDHIV